MFAHFNYLFDYSKRILSRVCAIRTLNTVLIYNSIELKIILIDNYANEQWMAANGCQLLPIAVNGPNRLIGHHCTGTAQALIAGTGSQWIFKDLILLTI